MVEEARLAGDELQDVKGQLQVAQIQVGRKQTPPPCVYLHCRIRIALLKMPPYIFIQLFAGIS